MFVRDADSFSFDRLFPPFRPILAKYCLTALSMKTRLYNKRLAMSVSCGLRNVGLRNRD